MRGRSARRWWLLLALLCASCGQDKTVKDHEVELSKAKAASEEAAAAKQKAEAAMHAADRNSQEIQARLDAAIKAHDALDQQISDAVTAVASSQSDDERSATFARLKLLQQQQAELKARVDAARAEFERAERHKGMKISQECIDDPLKESCL